MALHKTQCPHCFTSYVISDAQLRVSQGMVRCGTCRERFQARIIEETQAPRFDPRDAFIEPLSDEIDASASKTVRKIEEHLTPQEIEFVDPKTVSEQDPGYNDLDTEDSITFVEELEPQSVAPKLKVDIEQLSTSEVLANIRAKQKRKIAEQQELTLKLPVKSDPTPSLDDKQLDKKIDIRADEKRLNEPSLDGNIHLKAKRTPPDLDQTANNTTNNKESHDDRIEEEPIEKDSLSPAPESSPEVSIERTLFDLTAKREKRSKAWLYVPLLSIVIAALGVLLSYQLWVKQLIDFREDSFAHTKFEELTIPLTKELEKYGISLPMRRNLSQMKLLSAHTEPHPTESSTTLLRVNLVNRAAISQPLPWLEMSLMDAEGRLVSRRNLSPNDYIYNNDSLSHIGAQELKKITIELLSFPKHATGYELKLLDR